MKRRTPDERGSVMPFFLIMAVALLLCAGLVVDSGSTLVSRREAFTTADQAARAGAQAVASATLHGGNVGIDPALAVQAAQSYLQRTGRNGQVSVDGSQVTVTVEVPQHLFLLNTIGLSDRSVRGVGVATLQRGVDVGENT